MKTALTSPKFWFALGAAALFSLGVTVKAAGSPELVIISPTSQQVVIGDKITTKFGLTNFTLTDYQTHSRSVAGQGHIHLWLDQAELTKTSAVKITADTYTFENVKPGEHTLVAELVNNDHSALRPPVISKVMFSTALTPTPSSILNSSVFITSILAFILLVIALYFLNMQVTAISHSGKSNQKSERTVSKKKPRK